MLRNSASAKATIVAINEIIRLGDLEDYDKDYLEDAKRKLCLKVLEEEGNNTRKDVECLATLAREHLDRSMLWAEQEEESEYWRDLSRTLMEIE